MLGVKGEPVAIGKLERYVGDWHLAHGDETTPDIEKNGHRIAVVGSGPAGLACASDLAKMGYDVTVFEALHKLGGVLVYGIPEFRLPKDKIVAREIASLRRLGVKFETDVIVGRTVTVDSLLEDEGFDAVFIGSGAGLPRFMGIEGENLSRAQERIEETMDALIKGFDKQLDDLYRNEAMDIDSDIRVMENMLRRDTASVEDDFGLGGAAVQRAPDEE